MDSIFPNDKYSRTKFLRLSGAMISLGVLTGCGGNGLIGDSDIRTSESTSPAALKDTPEMQALLRRWNLLAVRENGVGVVRDDMKWNTTLVKRVTRPAMLICGCSGGGGGGDEGFDAEIDGVSVGSISSVAGLGFTAYSANYPYLDAQAQYDEMTVALNAVGNGGYFYGPTYTVGMSPAQACAENLFNSVDSAMKQLAVFIGSVAAAASKYGITSGVLASARGLLAGTVSLEGFLDVILATFTVSALAEILIDAGIGIAASLLVEYLWCLKNGG